MAKWSPAFAAQRFYEDVVLKYEGDACLFWPFARDHGGYGKIWRRKALRHLTREILEDVVGPPPTPEHQAAHSCGNGDLGCATLRHLSWKTRKENEADKKLHGTLMVGEKNPGAKITEADVLEIRRLRNVVSQTVLAKRYGLTSGRISKIQTGKGWATLPMAAPKNPPGLIFSGAKLTWEDVREMRRMDGVSYVKLARLFGVSPNAAKAIMTGTSWIERDGLSGKAIERKVTPRLRSMK